MSDEELSPVAWEKTLSSCGDGSCILRDKSDKGMRTNGGCQHLKLDRYQAKVLTRELATEVLRLRAALKHIAKGNISPSIDFAAKILDDWDLADAHRGTKE